MGCSNPHPHSQVWSLSTVPTIPSKELASLRNYASTTDICSGIPTGPDGHACLLCKYVHHELSVPEDEGRLVITNEHFVALVLWWAYWPFEIMGVLQVAYLWQIPALNPIFQCSLTNGTFPHLCILQSMRSTHLQTSCHA
jgi:galactose-1-phosphate uridylyltransferase